MGQVKMHLFFSVLLVLGFPFIMTEVVDPFSKCSEFFFKGEPPTIKGILEKSASQNNRYKLVCQRYKNKYRFATLYDRTGRIPVFSAYTYTKRQEDFKRPKIPWMIEPQLEILTAEMRDPCVNQACTEDYWNKQDLNRGHLFPQLHAADKDTAISTFTLTNIVPQKISFNDGSWNLMEKKVKNVIDSHCRDEKDSNKILAYVLTGAVPSQNELLNEKVNIPSHMWTVFCCYNSKSKKWESQAHWAKNIDESKDEHKTISEQSLENVQEFLKGEYKGEYTLFQGDCSILLNVDGSQPPKEDSDDQQNDEEMSYWSYFKQLPAKFWDWLRG
ncbi:endonuclease domain-containing 1 protein-like [Sinocyclocheilus rhinocerous]|uniref:endonuclease domain-containing 1 protein-like n=1 Tax=Sinocyclocheilus rhinocerous TaxID=307959 RepID=UPI0007B7C038|nr:PREDICTED: endonuclease domain-containing 1 protein-like [Sinocyclocheilus rhinocerous]